MDDARSIDAPKHGTIVRAGYQRDGRGRVAGRSWEAGKDENLLCTAVFDRERFEYPPQRVPILAGIAVAWTVEALTSRHAEIKWPNDVLVERSKIAGILCEADGERIYVGIGLNCNQVDFPEDLRTPAVSIRLIRGEAVEIAALCETLFADLFRALDSPEWRRELESRLYLRGEEATIERESRDGVKSEVVKIDGIAPDGALLVRDVSGKADSLYAGEVTLKS